MPLNEKYREFLDYSGGAFRKRLDKIETTLLKRNFGIRVGNILLEVRTRGKKAVVLRGIAKESRDRAEKLFGISREWDPERAIEILRDAKLFYLLVKKGYFEQVLDLFLWKIDRLPATQTYLNCPTHRYRLKKKMESELVNRNFGGRGSDFKPFRQMYDAVCAECGAETKVPFKPTEGRPVYCRKCYLKRRSGRE